jgi:hypothetical protein
VHGGQTPAALTDDFRKRKFQVFATPVFDDVVEHFQITRIKDDPGRIAMSKPDKKASSIVDGAARRS